MLRRTFRMSTLGILDELLDDAASSPSTSHSQPIGTATPGRRARAAALSGKDPATRVRAAQAPRRRAPRRHLGVHGQANFWMRSLFVSATYTFPLPSVATPKGELNCPLPEPQLPHVERKAPLASNFWIRRMTVVEAKTFPLPA